MSIELERELPNGRQRKNVQTPVSKIEQPQKVPRHTHNDIDSPKLDIRDIRKILQPKGISSQLAAKNIEDSPLGPLPDPIILLGETVGPNLAWLSKADEYIKELSRRNELLIDVLITNRFGAYDEPQDIVFFDRI